MSNMSLQAIKTELRYGQYAWPGGYPKFFITADGAALSYAAVKAEWRTICSAYIREAGHNNGWMIAGADVNWEDSELICDHTGNRIESAYAKTV